MINSPALRLDGNAVLLQVQAQPGAKQSGFAGVLSASHGQVVKIRIQAPAVEGKANAALQRFLADAFGVSPSRVLLLRGSTGKHKTWRIEQPRTVPDELRGLLPPDALRTLQP